MSAPWTYVYECPICEIAIQEGEDVAKDMDGETVHTECLFNGDDEPRDDPDAWSGGFADNH